jgi:hypothetical protein
VGNGKNRRKLLKIIEKCIKITKNENLSKKSRKLKKNMKKTQFLLKISKNHEIFVKFRKNGKN